MTEKFSESLKLLAIGSVMSISLSVGAYLLTGFFGSYTSKAVFNEFRAGMIVELREINKSLTIIREDVKEMRRENNK